MLKGSIVALVTPFTQDLKVDESKLKELIDWHIANGTAAILAGGTTGESATMTHDEHRKLIDLAVQYVNGRIPLIAGCGSNSTEEALGLVRYAQDKGADYALVITPYYNKPTQEGLYQHFKYIAERTAIPVILYNVPSRTGVNMLPATSARLYNEFKNIIGSKEATGSLEQNIELMSLVDENFCLLSGDDATIVPMMSVGAKGVISVVANIMPKETSAMVQACFDGDFEAAKEMQLKLYALIKMMFVETNPMPAKTALAAMGRLEEYFRLPLSGMSEVNKEELIKLLKEYELI